MDPITVDDSDLSQLIFSKNGWFTAGSSSEYNSTTHGTHQPGTTVTFKFNGTSVSTYGTIGSTNPTQISSSPACNSTYQIDGASAVSYTQPFVSSTLYKVQLFQSPPLQDGEHTLVVTANCVQEGPWYWFDFLTYLPSAPSKENASSVTMTSSVTFTLPSTTSLTAASSSAASGPNSGLLAAAIATPVIVLLLAGFGFLWWRIRHTRRTRNMGIVLDEEDPPVSSIHIGTWDISPFTTATNSDAQREKASPVSSTQSGPYATSPSTEQGSSVSREEKSLPPRPVDDSEVTQHTDGGVSLSAGPGLTELPPAYGHF